MCTSECSADSKESSKNASRSHILPEKRKVCSQCQRLPRQNKTVTTAKPFTPPEGHRSSSIAFETVGQEFVQHLQRALETISVVLHTL